MEDEKKEMKIFFSHCSKKSPKTARKFSQDMSWMSHSAEETTDFHGTNPLPLGGHLF